MDRTFNTSDTLLLATKLHLVPSTVKLVLLCAVIALFAWLYKQAFGTDVARIRGLPEAPGAVPFYGHLKVMGKDHATYFQSVSRQKKWDVFQARMGTQRVVVLNTYQAAQEWIAHNQAALIDRPLFWTFAKILSSSQGMTIGTSPWDESCKRRRTSLGTVLSRPAIQKAASMLDIESFAMVRDMYDASQGGQLQLSPEKYCKRLSLNLTLVMCYGTRFKSIQDPLFLEIVDTVQTISSFRSTNNNPQDYVPLLRYFSFKGRQQLADRMRERRDVFLGKLLQHVKDSIDAGRSTSCFSEGLLRDGGSNKLNHDDPDCRSFKTPSEEIKSVNVSLVSGGFETISTTCNASLGLLCTEYGQKIQDRIHSELMEMYDGVIQDAWAGAVVEEKSPYLVATVREMLRYFAPIQLLPPRKTYTGFSWRGIKIPKGVTVYQNAQAINHDLSFYGPTAEQFIPDRWLESDPDPNHKKIGPPYHYSFGAGSRACPAVAISNRVLYSTFARLILLFKVVGAPPGSGQEPNTHYIHYNSDTTAQTAIVKPYSFTLRPRVNVEDIQACFQHSSEATEREEGL